MSASLRAHADVLREALEAVLLALDARGGHAQTEQALRETIAALSTFAELSLDDPLALREIERATSALAAVRESFEPASGVVADEEALSLFDEASEWMTNIRRELGDRRVAAVPVEKSGNVESFLASAGSAALFVGVEVPPPELMPVDRRWAAYEEGADKPERRALPPLPADLPYQQIEAIARDLMEDLAMLGTLRDALEEQPWAESGPFEERLLHNLDALIALELPLRKEVPRLQLVRQLYRYATEWQVPDGGRSFVFAFTLACLHSEAALRWLVLGAHRAPPRALPAFGKALALGSSPHIPGAVQALMASESAPLLTLGLEVARRRRHFDPAFLPLIAHPDVSVAEAALRAFTFAPRAAAIETLLHVLDKGGHLAAVAAEILATMGHPRAVPVARELLAAAPKPAAARLALRVVVLHGDRNDAELVQAHALAIPEALPLLGFFGAPEHAQVIVEQLRNPDRVPDAERALLRLTGLPFLPPYDVDALQREVAQRVPAWTFRVRFGKPFQGVRDTLAELRAPLTLQRDRRVLSVEAGMFAKEPMRVDLDGWVAQQQADLAALS